MARNRSRDRQQKTKAWQPMERGEVNPTYIERHYAAYGGRLPDDVLRIEAWSNDIYQATIEHRHDGSAYISFKRHDRVAAHDWRHNQAIKNELAGPEREAVELYPAESRLLDQSNQYHLFVAPEGVRLPIGDQGGRQILDAPDVRELNRIDHVDGGPGKARQRAWQPGLPTGPNV